MDEPFQATENCAGRGVGHDVFSAEGRFALSGESWSREEGDSKKDEEPMNSVAVLRGHGSDARHAECLTVMRQNGISDHQRRLPLLDGLDARKDSRRGSKKTSISG